MSILPKQPQPQARAPQMSDREAEAVGRHTPEPSFRKRLLAPVAVAFGRVLIEWLNSLEMINEEVFHEALAQDRPLLTFSNHVSLFDDPWLVATFSPPSFSKTRWCATDALNFFSSPMSARFFSAGKGVPIVRGAGLEQPGMTFLRDRLREGDWVHIFPEGGRSRDPRKIRTPLKTGMAHLIKATRPLLLPFHHHGMEGVLPIGSNFPRFGNQISLRFGEVLDSDLGLADESVQAITDWAQEQLLALEALAYEAPAR